ncbi:MAG: hypothetical protein R3B13_04260 [Polyangiaceae bacterium]
MQATWQARSAAASHQWAAQAEQRRHAQQKRSHVVALVVLGALSGLLILSMVMRAMGQARMEARSYEVDPLAAAAAGIGGTLFGLVLLAVFVANSYAFYRLLVRHRQRAARATNSDWFAEGKGHAPAICGACGAPIAFTPGEQSVTCGHCRSTVVATHQHGHQLISIAYDGTQLAALERARAQRARVKDELSQRRRVMMLASFVAFGACFALFLPLLIAGYTLRTVTRSVEQHMLDLARDLGGEFGAGMDALFDWLDMFWIGEAPRTFTHLSPGIGALFNSRWSVSAVFHDRPVLVLAVTDLTDRALRPHLLLARPRTRSEATVARAAQTPAARRIRELGFHYTLTYSGVALDGPSMLAGRLDAATISTLALAAYELAEEP